MSKKISKEKDIDEAHKENVVKYKVENKLWASINSKKIHEQNTDKDLDPKYNFNF